MQLRSVLGILGAMSGYLLFASVSQAQCTKDTDCKGERVCEQGACVTPNPAQPPAPAPPTDAAPGGATATPAGATPANGADAAAVTPRDPFGTSAAPAPVDAVEAKPKMVRHSTGMMAGGIVMVAFVPIALLAAMVANLEQTACESGTYYSTGSVSSLGTNCGRFDKTIYGGLISAAVLTGVGIPLIVIGGKKEPVGTAQLTPWATPHGVGLGLRVDL
jgi:hypothetical protein